MTGTTVKNTRLQYITLSQVMGCLLVIFGHSYPFVTEVPGALIDIRTFVYYFHMPLFVWCSGYLFVKTNQSTKYSFSRYSFRRLKKLIVPYAAFSFIGLMPKILFSAVLNDSAQMGFAGMVRVFLVPRENIWGHFWFLPMIFFMGLAGYGIDKFYIGKSDKYKISVFAAATVILVFMSFIRFSGDEWLGIRDFLKYMWVYTLGMMCALFPEKDRREIKLVVPILLLVASIAVFLAMSQMVFIVRTLRSMIISVLMTTAVVTACRIFENRIRVPANSVILQTFTIFILSWPCQLAAEVVLERLLYAPMLVTSLAMLVAGIVGPIVIIKLVDLFEQKTNTRILSFLLGR